MFSNAYYICCGLRTAITDIFIFTFFNILLHRNIVRGTAAGPSGVFVDKVYVV
jgi:hypothetical protein